MKVIPLKRQIWIKDEGEGYRLADLLDTVVDDVIVAIHNEKGIYERVREREGRERGRGGGERAIPHLESIAHAP